VLVADSGVTNGVAWVDPLTNRNVIINGAMQVAQRGTSTTGITSSGYYTADRWRFAVASIGTWTQTIENDAPTGSGFRKSWKTLCTTADSTPAADDQLRFEGRLEGQDLQRIRKGTSSAQQLTLSFWVKSNVTGTYVFNLFDTDNTRQVSAAYTISASGTWEKKTITFPADTTGAFDNDNGNSLTARWNLSAGSNRNSGTLRTTWTSTVTADEAVGQTNLAAATDNYWQITGVQLEAGAVATPFEFENIGTTLAKCQRYFTRSDLIVRAVPRFTDGIALSTVYFKVSMRSAPTVTITNVTGTNNCDATATDGFKTYSSAAHTNNESSFSWTAAIEL
jgi:hypothetical protein